MILPKAKHDQNILISSCLFSPLFCQIVIPPVFSVFRNNLKLATCMFFTIPLCYIFHQFCSFLALDKRFHKLFSFMNGKFSNPSKKFYGREKDNFQNFSEKNGPKMFFLNSRNDFEHFTLLQSSW